MRVIFSFTMAMDRNTYRFESTIEPLDARTLFAVGLIPAPNGPGYDSIQKQILTADGTIIAGLFSGKLTFGQSSSTQKTLTARGDTDIYVASYDSSGNLIWINQIGGDFTDRAMSQYKKRDMLTNPKRITAFVGKIGEQPRKAGEYIYDIAVDSSGNVVLAGSFTGTIKLGGHTYAADDSIVENFYDGFITKISSTGSTSWVQQFGGPFDDVAGSLALDNAGNVYVGGYYTRQADFDQSRRVRLLTTKGRDAGFISRYSASGVLSWVYQFTSETANRFVRNAVNDIAVTGNGEVYFGGTFGDNTNFNPANPDSFIEPVGQTDAVVGKLNRKGALSWVQTTGGEKSDGNSAITIDSAGNVYTAGYFADEQDVDPRSNVINILTPISEDGSDKPDFSDILLSKFTATGTPVWQGQMGGGNIELVADMGITTDGAINISGSFFGEADFAPGPNDHLLNSAKVVNDDSIKDLNTNFGRNDSYDWFFVRISPRGKFVSAANYGGADDDYNSGLSVFGNTVYISGRSVDAIGDRDGRNEFGQTILSAGSI